MLGVPRLGKGDFLGDFLNAFVRSFIRGSQESWESNPASMLIEIVIVVAFIFGIGFLIKKIANKSQKNDQD